MTEDKEFRRQEVMINKAIKTSNLSPHNKCGSWSGVDKVAWVYFSNNICFKKKAAFTLAETLITLVIIGIVAAITVPNLLYNYRKKELKTRFVKAYSTIVQLHQKTCSDNSLNYQDIVDMFKTSDGIAKYRTMIYKSSQSLDPICFDRAKQKCRIWSSVTYKDYKGNGKIYTPQPYFERFQNGMTISFDTPIQTFQRSFIVVDTNGPKQPNRMGFDIFLFNLNSKNAIIPGPFSNCSKTMPVSNANGMACTVYALKDICPDDSKLSYWDCLPH